MQMNDNIYTTVVLLLLTYNLDDNFYPVAKSLNGRGVIFDNRWVFTSCQSCQFGVFLSKRDDPMNYSCTSAGVSGYVCE